MMESQLNSIIYQLSNRIIKQELAGCGEGFIHDELNRLNDIVNFSSAIVCCVGQHQGIREILKIVNHSYPPHWVSSYINENFLLIDPIINMKNPGLCIAEWNEISSTHNNSRYFWEAAFDAGLKNGISVKSYNIIGSTETIISLTNLLPKDLYVAKTILCTLLPIFDYVLNKEKTLNNNLLTPKETEVIKWCSEGKTVWEISKILRISEATVKFHIKNIFYKLQANTKTLAVIKAIRLKIIK